MYRVNTTPHSVHNAAMANPELFKCFVTIDEWLNLDLFVQPTLITESVNMLDMAPPTFGLNRMDGVMTKNFLSSQLPSEMQKSSNFGSLVSPVLSPKTDENTSSDKLAEIIDKRDDRNKTKRKSEGTDLCEPKKKNTSTDVPNIKNFLDMLPDIFFKDGKTMGHFEYFGAELDPLFQIANFLNRDSTQDSKELVTFFKFFVVIAAMLLEREKFEEWFKEQYVREKYDANPVDLNNTLHNFVENNKNNSEPATDRSLALANYYIHNIQTNPPDIQCNTEGYFECDVGALDFLNEEDKMFVQIMIENLVSGNTIFTNLIVNAVFVQLATDTPKILANLAFTCKDKWKHVVDLLMLFSHNFSNVDTNIKINNAKQCVELYFMQKSSANVPTIKRLLRASYVVAMNFFMSSHNAKLKNVI